MAEPPLRVDTVMSEIGRDARSRLRRHLLKRGGAADYQDDAVFAAVQALLVRAIDERNPDALLLPELLDADVDWQLETHLSLSTHRALVGRAILWTKRKVLLPLTRWLFEYSQENFRRQQYLNRIMFACIEELALDNARLRRAIDARAASAGQARPDRALNPEHPENP
jgi:hypothetical protein